MRRRRALAGAGAGLAVWLACHFFLRDLPAPIAFYVTAFAFIFGCGALPLTAFEAHTSAPERTALACALGMAVAPLLLFVLAMFRCRFLFAPLAFAATGAAVALWFAGTRRGVPPRHGELRWLAIVALIVFALSSWVSSSRISMAADSISIFGDYDTFDLTFGAAMASELSHSIPPASPFYAGHWLVYSYFPLLLLAEIHNFSGVSTIQISLAFAWPFFGLLAAGAIFAFCRRLGSDLFAVLATLLIFTGTSLAYVAAAFWPHMVKFDRLIWSSMFMAPSAEWLYFNAWTPALAVIGVGLYAVTRIDDEDNGRQWTLLAGICFGLLFMVKSFAFALVVAAVGMTGLVCWLRKDRGAGRLIAIAAIASACAAPWLISILTLNRAEQRAGVAIEPLSLVRRMLFKADLTTPLAAFADRLVGSDPHAWVLLTIATVIFLAGGLGTRVLGIRGVARAAGGAESMRGWTPLAWLVVLGMSIPFVFAVAPFPNSIQAYQLALFCLWPFSVYAVWPRGARPSWQRWAATAVLVCLSIPGTVHYLQRAHAAARKPRLTGLDAGDLQVVRYLRRTDPETTLLLHSDPLWPSLYAIESERRVLLAWSSYVAGDGSADVDARAAEIARFFGSPAKPGVNDMSILTRYHVTHVIERPARDRLDPHVRTQLHLVTGTPDVRLYEVPAPLTQGQTGS
jgi:hypothetical protein